MAYRQGRRVREYDWHKESVDDETEHHFPMREHRYQNPYQVLAAHRCGAVDEVCELESPNGRRSRNRNQLANCMLCILRIRAEYSHRDARINPQTMRHKRCLAEGVWPRLCGYAERERERVRFDGNRRRFDGIN